MSFRTLRQEYRVNSTKPIGFIKASVGRKCEWVVTGLVGWILRKWLCFSECEGSLSRYFRECHEVES